MGLLDAQFDVLGILVELLRAHPSDVDLVVYILDIFGRVSRDSEDAREVLLSPRYFDRFLAALDPWWEYFLASSRKMAEFSAQSPNAPPKTVFNRMTRAM